MANRELSKAEWLGKAEAYCARAEHCAADVRRKLFEWGAPSDLFDEIGQNLYADGFLNDRRFCHAYVRDKLEYNQWGKLKIRAGLQSLQLPEPAIREALDEIDEEEYNRILKHVINNSGRRDEQLLRFLLQRGFSYEDIKKCK
ncbi:MAG: RecX family transcriptional regulator [Paludibacteraceae bacterium]|nr:RecX family transcriptional regulator [Paludibacteraceae bacterium]